MNRINSYIFAAYLMLMILVLLRLLALTSFQKSKYSYRIFFMTETPKTHFLVSGWEDDLNDIDEELNPHETPEKEILWAAEKGNLVIISNILRENPELVNIQDKDGYSPLHRACYSNHIEIVEYLLDHGANISATTEMLWQPLHSCCQWNHKEIASILLQGGADVNAMSSGKQTPLHIAASHGTDYGMVQLLLIQPFVNHNLKNNSGETAYDIARRSSKYYSIFEMSDEYLKI